MENNHEARNINQTFLKGIHIEGEKKNDKEKNFQLRDENLLLSKQVKKLNFTY